MVEPELRTHEQLTDAEAAAVRELVATAAAVDGFNALNEAAALRLSHARPGVRHLVATAGGALAGYAQLDPTPQPTGQLLVDPRLRRRGVGRALLDQLLRLDRDGGPLRIWAMGNSPAAQALAAGAGLVPVRELQIMERDLSGELVDAPPPPGVALRSFVPGQDDDAWVAVNARAFAHHPEQGAMTREDLAERLAEPWFDPAGFLLAEAAGGLLGFHWTKQHPGRVGEVYVLGVDPDAGGQGLGKVLLAAGLRRLRDRGNDVVRLYVEADNGPARALYGSYGFHVASRDVMYASAA